MPGKRKGKTPHQLRESFVQAAKGNNPGRRSILNLSPAEQRERKRRGRQILSSKSYQEAVQRERKKKDLKKATQAAKRKKK